MASAMVAIVRVFMWSSVGLWVKGDPCRTSLHQPFG